jgi:hypothetical protein
MNRQWSVRRQWTETQDAQRRWDRAYQYLLQWSCETSRLQSTAILASAQPIQEVNHENRSVCPSIDPDTVPDTEH